MGLNICASKSPYDRFSLNFSGGIAVLVLSNSINGMYDERSQISASLSFTVLCDLLIASSMTWYFYKNKTGIARTDTILTKLIIYAVSTGMLTTFVSSTVDAHW